MYTVSPPIGSGDFAPETHVLGQSPPMVELNAFAYQFVIEGIVAGNECVIITTDRNALIVAEALRDIAPDVDYSRLGIVDATGYVVDDSEKPYHVEMVDSPGDLTGIGIALSRLFNEIEFESEPQFRVVIDSLSTLPVYTDFQRVYQFIHTMTNQLNQIGGVSLSLMKSGTGQGNFEKLRNSFSGVVEMREHNGSIQYQRHGVNATTDWQECIHNSQSPQDLQVGSDVDFRSEVSVETEVQLESATSISEIIDIINNQDLSLTVYNQTISEEKITEITEYFERLNVTVRSDTFSMDTPTNVGILHRGNEAISMSQLEELYDSIHVDETAVNPGRIHEITRSKLLHHAQNGRFTIENGGKKEMIAISRPMETRALENNGGAIHTAFQTIDRIRDEYGTQKMYEALVANNVETHLYGYEGTPPNEEQYSIHRDECSELKSAWFVVCDSDDPTRKGALVSEEVAPGEYTGFWTYDPAIVDIVVTYLEKTYCS